MCRVSVCVYVHVCICVFLYVHVCLCVCMCMCMCVYMYEYVFMYEHVVCVWVWLVGTDIAPPTIPNQLSPPHTIYVHCICDLCVFSPLTSSTPSIPKPACTGGGVLTCQRH